MSNPYDHVLGADHNTTPTPKKINQLSLDRRLVKVVSNALLNQLFAANNIPETVTKLSELPSNVRGKVKALMKAMDALLMGVPITLWYELNTEINAYVITQFTMASSDGESIYTPSKIACQCLGSTHHNLCYHRWAYLIFEKYLVLLKGHEEISDAYKSIGMAFEVRMFERDATEQFIDAMMQEPPITGETFH